jgi:hypothetical protein
MSPFAPEDPALQVHAVIDVLEDGEFASSGHILHALTPFNGPY